MAIPSAVVNAGNGHQQQNIFRITFSQALSSIPTLEAWDDSTFSTTLKEMFTGTAGNGNVPYVSGLATTDTAPGGPSWEPASPVAGGAVANRLQGTTSYVNLAAEIPTAGFSVRFNLNWQVGYDATVPATTTQNGVLACRYAYSGTAPSLTWAYNDSGAGGTEAAPQWTTITPGSAGNYIRPMDSSSNSSSPVWTRPTSGVADAPTIWVTAT